MTDCIYKNLITQMERSLQEIFSAFKNYLENRKHGDFEKMTKTWALFDLKIKPNPPAPETITNELHKTIYNFYLNVDKFKKLIRHVFQDTNGNKDIIEHAEDIKIDIIISFFQIIDNLLKFNAEETKNLLENVDINVPNLDDHGVEFDESIDREIRDFKIVIGIIEELKHVLELLNKECN